MSLRILSVLLLGLMLNGHAGAASKVMAVPMLTDLSRDSTQAQRQGKPIILFFTLPGCSFCHVVRNNYLLPLLRDARVKERPIIREVDVTGTQAVVNLDHSWGNHRSIAKTYKIHAAPTVLFLDAAGCLLTAPIVGGDIAGLYGGYLDNAFAEAEKKIATARKHNKANKGCVQP
ncbi:thioredoxin family protein [Herminiimonas arsenitoxidans]|uniref:thioredoxin family protein n=1 Tax=Herminiimonas arsenitoxidans TaxID=1809410 RepID=UPI000970FCEF|nr:thioredoxin fold domain-containing protein [Herminiimonas arsenitoxidans]